MPFQCASTEEKVVFLFRKTEHGGATCDGDWRREKKVVVRSGYTKALTGTWDYATLQALELLAAEL